MNVLPNATLLVFLDLVCQTMRPKLVPQRVVGPDILLNVFGNLARKIIGLNLPEIFKVHILTHS